MMDARTRFAKQSFSSLLSIADLCPAQLESLLSLASELKCGNVAAAPSLLKGKCVAMIFEKPSTRTRVSFEAGIAQLGGAVIFLGSKDLQLSRGEPLSDTAKTLSRYVDCIVVRLFKHSDAVELAKHSSVPVINALTDWEHPCQVLADLLTMKEKKGKLAGLKVAYLGDAQNNVARSLLLGCGMLGVDIALACPVEYSPDEASLWKAKEGTAKITVTQDPFVAVKGADVVYTDTWVSMGDEAEKEKRVKALAPYQVNAELMASAKPDAIFMHDLPAYRGYEVAADVIDGPQSVVWGQAENRLHVQKALLVKLLASCDR